jgi:alkylhydroperoxidase family enzyme
MPKDKMSPPGGWCIVNSPRVPLVSPNETSLSTRFKMLRIHLIHKLNLDNLLLLMDNNTRLLRGLDAYVSKMMPYGEMDRKDTELVVLRIAWNCRARYVWGQHVEIGLSVGLASDDIVAIGRGHEDPRWSCKQTSLLKATDEFHKERFVSDDTWRKLATHFDERLQLELLLLIGFYEGFAGALNSAGLALDAGVAERHVTDIGLSY